MKISKQVLGMLVCAVVLTCMAGVSFAGLAAETESWTAADVQELNSYSPSAQKVFLGQRLRGQLTREVTTYSTAGSVDLDVANDRVMLFDTTGISDIIDNSFANGQPGQQVTLVFVTDGGWNIGVTPVTATGFTSITMDSAGDTCELTYQDDTVGWVVSGSNSCTVTQ